MISYKKIIEVAAEKGAQLLDNLNELWPFSSGTLN